MRRYLPNIPLTLVVLMWGFNFVALKLVYREMSAPVTSMLRYLVMCSILVAFIPFRRERLSYQTGDRSRLWLVGFLSLGLYMVLFMEGMKRTGPAEGAVILATSPVMTYLVSVMLKREPLLPRALLGTLMAFGGVAAFVFTGMAKGGGTLLGNGLCFASAVVWAWTPLTMKPMLARYTPVAALTLSLPGALPALLPHGANPLFHAELGKVSLMGWWAFAHVSILSGLVAFVLYYEGIRQVGPSRATLYQFLVPPTAAFFAWWVLKQPITLGQIFAIGIVLLGIGIANRARQMAPPVQPVPESQTSGA